MESSLDADVLIRAARVVPVGTVPAPNGLVDVRVTGGVVTQLAPVLAPVQGERVLDADGRWLLPGLWDKHIHMSVWAPTVTWADLRGSRSAAQAVATVLEYMRGRPDDTSAVVGFGHRASQWPDEPLVSELDAITGTRPVALISGDAHTGWLNTTALRLLGGIETGRPIAENDWFGVFARLSELPGYPETDDAMYRRAIADASAKGIVGVVDMEFMNGYIDWPSRVARGVDGIRVRPATYSAGLGEVLERGWRTGDPLPGGAGLVTMGPLKIIGDGTLTTRTACCHDPYADATSAQDRGSLNLGEAEIETLVAKAHAGGLEAAVHAIGDAAISATLDIFERTGARGSVEHAQLMTWPDVERMGHLDLTASVQPANLWDDRDLIMKLWPERADRCYPFRALADAGVTLALGSDAPVSALDPWLTLAAAVLRSGDEREPWHPEQALSASEAVAASTDGEGTVAVGSLGDLILVDADPVQPGDPPVVAERLRNMVVSATVVGGRVTHTSLR